MQETGFYQTAIGYLSIKKKISEHSKSAARVLWIWGLVNCFTGRNVIDFVKNVQHLSQILYLISALLLGALMFIIGKIGIRIKNISLFLSGFLVIAGLLNIFDI